MTSIDHGVCQVQLRKYSNSVGKHTSAGEASRCRTLGEWGAEKPVAVTSVVATPPRRTVFHLRRVLTKGKRLRSVELGPLLDLPEATLAGKLVFLGAHLDIILWIAQCPMFRKECAVATLQNVHVRIAEVRILVHVIGTILVPDILRHDRGPMGGIFAMKDQGRPRLWACEEFGGQKVLVVVVHGSGDVPALVLILEAAVDDHDVIETIIVLAIQELHEDTLVDARQCIGLVLRKGVRELQARGSFNVGDRRKWCICSIVSLFIDNNILRVLKHAQRASALFPRARHRVGIFADRSRRGRAIAADMAPTASKLGSQTGIDQDSAGVATQ